MQTLSAIDTATSVRRSLPSRRDLLIATIFIACYVLIGWATRSYMVRPFGITPWNPTAGLALALLLVFGVRFWPALAVATCISNLMARGIPAAPYLQLLIPVAITAGYAGMAGILRGPLGFRLEFDRLRDVLSLVAVTAAGTLLIAIVYVTVIDLDNPLPAVEYQHTIFRSWIGHLVGIVINTPLLLLLANRTQLGRALRQWPPLEIAAQACAVTITLWVVFGLAWADPYKLFYLLFMPMIWIAMRHAMVGVTLGLAVIQLGLIMAVGSVAYDGSLALTELQFMMLALAVTGLVLGTVVGESRLANRALNESESRLRAIVSTAPDSIVTVDARGVVVEANLAALRIFGYPTEEFIGKHVHEFLPEFGRIASDREVTEVMAVRRDRSKFPAELSVGVTGLGLHELSIAIARDISRRKEVERQLAEKQAELNRSARLAAAGEMAAALAHELHQPLSAIRNYVRAAQMLAPAGDTGHVMQKVEHEAARAAEVVRRLRNFFRGGSSQLERVGVAQLIKGALDPMREEAAFQHVTLDTGTAGVEVDLLVDRVQVETVVHCLVGNSIESIAAAGAELRHIRVSAKKTHDGWVNFYVADSGPGVSPAIADRLFEPFATTKPTGIGLGLAMSRSMIESHGGKLWIETAATGGTMFCFSLPIANPQEAHS
jgi:PAS domain S-box-containing protein